MINVKLVGEFVDFLFDWLVLDFVLCHISSKMISAVALLVQLLMAG